MQRNRGQRINFRIAHCSSEDPQNPASQLLLQSPNSKGWQSKRFCQYPQTIIYQLVEPTLIKQITLLSHQSKISTKVVMHNKLDTNKDWHKLGYLSLQSNVNSNYQARQLKTVQLSDKTTLMVKFTFQANYVNTYNVFNQVGVITLCVFGDRMVMEESPQKYISVPPINNNSQYIDKLDKHIIAKLKDLQIRKSLAIDQQNYDKAQAIKDQIDSIRSIGSTLIALESKKKKAIANQDFDSAKIINQKIKQLRDSAGGGPNFTSNPSGSPSDYFRQKNPEYVQQQQSVISPMAMVKKQKRDPIIRHKSPKRNIKMDMEMDQRPIYVRNKNPYENVEDDERFSQAMQKADTREQISYLSAEDRTQCSRYFSVFDQKIFMHIFSSYHANREKGLDLVKAQIFNGNNKSHGLAQAFLYVIRKMMEDKTISVLILTLDLFSMGMKKLKPAQSPGNSQQVQAILQKFNDNLAHPTQKVKLMTENIYISLPQYQLTNKDICYKVLTIPSKRQKPSKILAGRLITIAEIVKDHRLGKNYDIIIDFALKYADDRNNDVRNSAIALICTISNQIGYSSIQPYLKSLRPPIRKTIEDRAGGGDNKNYQNSPLPTKKKLMPIGKYQKQQQLQRESNQFINSPPPKKSIKNPQYTCQFCERFDKKFQNEDYRDLHMFSFCPMLTLCQQCKQAVEVSLLIAHKLSQCKNSKYHKKCPRCKQAVHQRIYKTHVQKKQCLPGKGLAVANRCPLCHQDIDPGKDGWISHLAKQGCQNNPRK